MRRLTHTRHPTGRRTVTVATADSRARARETRPFECAVSVCGDWKGRSAVFATGFAPRHHLLESLPMAGWDTHTSATHASRAQEARSIHVNIRDDAYEICRQAHRAGRLQVQPALCTEHTPHSTSLFCTYVTRDLLLLTFTRRGTPCDRLCATASTPTWGARCTQYA